MSPLPNLDAPELETFAAELIGAGISRDDLEWSAEDESDLLRFCADAGRPDLMTGIVAAMRSDRLRPFLSRSFPHLAHPEAMAEGLEPRDDVSLTMAVAVYLEVGHYLYLPNPGLAAESAGVGAQVAVAARMAEAINGGRYRYDAADMDTDWSKFHGALERFLESPAQASRGRGWLDPARIDPAIDAIRHGGRTRRVPEVAGRAVTLDDLSRAAGQIHSGSARGTAREAVILDAFAKVQGGEAAPMTEPRRDSVLIEGVEPRKVMPILIAVILLIGLVSLALSIR